MCCAGVNLAVLSSGARKVPATDVESKMLAGLRQKPLREHAANSIDGVKDRDRHDLLGSEKGHGCSKRYYRPTLLRRLA
jgi:hypothetical protein